MLDNEYPPLGGGTGVVNEHLLIEMASYPDITVDLVTSSRTATEYETHRMSERITMYKVPVDNRNIHHSTNVELLRYSWRGLRFARKLLSREVYQLSFAFAGVPAGVMSYALKLSHGLPYIVSLQGPDVPGFEARYNYLYPALKPLLRIIWKNAAFVTAISREHRDLALRALPSLTIPIVYNGVDTAQFHPADTPRACDTLTLLCVGRLIERKGQHHLLRAFGRLRALQQQPPRLILAGTGDAHASLQKLAQDLGITDAVDFLGFVPREQMAALYRQTDIFVLPSQNEGMSIALLEAMASGLPVVVTQTGGTSELVSDAINGRVVQWADVDGLTNALAPMVSDAGLRQRMGRTGRERAERFSWPEITREYLRLFEQVARR